LVLIYIGKTL